MAWIHTPSKSVYAARVRNTVRKATVRKNLREWTIKYSFVDRAIKMGVPSDADAMYARIERIVDEHAEK